MPAAWRLLDFGALSLAKPMFFMAFAFGVRDAFLSGK
jgi:hypothetical protein